MIIKSIKRYAKYTPNVVAYNIDNNKITYKELYKRIEKYGELLKREGRGPIIVYGHKSIDTFVTILSCIYAKRTYIPIDIFTPIERIKTIIDSTKSNIIITDEELNIESINIYKLNDLEIFNNNNILDNNNQICYIIFTSGSTGVPKGVPISYDNLNNYIEWVNNLKYIDKHEYNNVLNQASFSFDLSVCDIFISLYNGYTLNALNKATYTDLDYVYKTIKDNNISIIVSTPTFIKMCLLDPLFYESNYPFLKTFIFCGEVLEISLARKILEKFPNIEIVNAYGPTEATCFVCSTIITKKDLDKNILPVGDMNNTSTNIIINNGIILLSGPAVFNGYLNNDNNPFIELNTIKYYNTNDIGYIEDNRLYCIGRADSQIKLNGYRIELLEIENKIKELNYITDCVVVAKKQDNQVKYIKAFITVNKDINTDEIYNYLKERIPIYMIPKYIEILDAMPTNNNGKIDRKKISEL